MRILFLDDLRTPDFDCTIVRTVEDAMARIFDGWDELWLDHDLGLDANGEPITARPIVSFLEERAFYGNVLEIGRVFIHSRNTVGADWMAAGLANCYYRVTRIELPPEN